MERAFNFDLSRLKRTYKELKLTDGIFSIKSLAVFKAYL